MAVKFIDDIEPGKLIATDAVRQARRTIVDALRAARSLENTWIAKQTAIDIVEAALRAEGE